MARMSRSIAPAWRPLAVVVVVVALSTCANGSGSVSSPSASGTDASSTRFETSAPPTVTSEPTSSATERPPTASPEGTVRLPNDAPTMYEESVDASDVPLQSLAPPRSTVGATWTGEVLTLSHSAASQALAFAWSRGGAGGSESGLEIWDRWDSAVHAPWNVVYAFTDRPVTGVLGVRFESGDLTHDRSPDLLSFESLGGSGACGIWRVIRMQVGAYEQIYRSQTCDTDVRISAGDLAIRESVYGPEDAHCCPSSYRLTTLRWVRERWKVSSRTTVPA